MTVFPRLELHGGTVSAPSPGSFHVVRAVDLAKAEDGRRLIADAWIQADQILADAHKEAGDCVAQARADMAAAHSVWFADQAQLFESRTAEAIDLMCRTTAQISEAVIAAIFERMPSLPIQASVDIAVRLLRSEMRSHVLCHALDFDAVNAASATLGAELTQADDAVRRGELIFRDAQGDVRVDGTDALLQLLGDWKSALSIALPATPNHPSTTESEKTP